MEDTAQQVRIMLVEDHVSFRRAMAFLLEREADLTVVAQAGSLDEARRHAASVGFDVAVLDFGLPDGEGVDLIKELRQANAGVAVLVLSASLDTTNLERAMEAGADEMLSKISTPAEIVGAIRRIGGR